jgi:class 3 adenylate cyclase/pimeloyl-ACP methyl ester carboxylesterase
VEVPEVEFVEVDGLRIAWQQFGSGPDCVVIPPLVSNVELQWEHEFYRRAMEGHGRYMRVTHFDKRGIGLSDRIDELPTLEQRIHDIGAVMDAAGLERAHLFGISEGGLMALLFAARHPERVDRMVVANSASTGFTPSPEEAAAWAANYARVAEDWGRDAQSIVEWFSPSNASNEAFVRWFGRLQRQSATRTDFERLVQGLAVLQADGDDFLAEVMAPTLVINAALDQVVDPRSGDRLAERIPNAERILIDNNDDHFLLLGDHWLDALTPLVQFLTGDRLARSGERRFATVAFTDIVGSTAAAASMGDHAWRRALEEHDRIAWEQADRHAATIVKSTGDGLLARFDSPHQAIAFCRDLRSQLAGVGLRIRAGIHCGEIELGPSQDITGIAVNLAARVEQSADDDTIFVSSTVRDILLGGEERFDDRGEHRLKGFDAPWRLYQLTTT